MATKSDKAVVATTADMASRRKGRPALPVAQRSVAGSVRLTPEEWAKLRRLGSVWLRKAIARAREPNLR